MTKYDEVHIERLGIIGLEDIKYTLECDLAWVQRDLSVPSPINTDHLLDAHNKYSGLLKKVRERLEMLGGEA
tara:strand:+ start:309 stop:524 length:216 start_codon:yes stop_codon:yes gene_type:complete